MTALETVALFFFRRRQSVQQVVLPMPEGNRPALLVDGKVTVVVHPKTYVAVYRKTGERKHGLRERLLRHYAANDYTVAMLETDSGTVAFADAVTMLAASMGGVTPGAIEGSAEKTSFTPRRVFQLFDVTTGAALVNPEVAP
jgi:hypothetical protein